ncbi:hypothetical protein HOP50_15g74590 [Chloropicon primus]|uniref:DUF952 domain-containing protein n=1 Tax=Chloropicon primus TaxID=1764295 RepID=A0A5B8MXR4_9CHLO|nr:hypothetical protein A3770_15p74340 [Chloropicon primus]UPR04125.1 hypothetical protein HOP50_15g74590 [Chloropicon primus]|eukprot:QDZ24916.1 hypothetical protein A3770_15p74340 [Chloropicon primus]
MYYHLVPQTEWRLCQEEGKPYYPKTYEADGFTHLSDNTDVLLSIGNHFYKTIPGRFLVLEVDPARLTSEVKLEPAAPVGEIKPHDTIDEKLFPHCYGPIDLASVVKELKVDRSDDDGAFLGLEKA